MEQQSIVWNGNYDLGLAKRPIQACQQGELSIRVEACAVCGSDIRTYKFGHNRVKPGTVVGHEIAGVIADVGEGIEDYKIGDRVAVGADVPCGSCFYCQNNRPNQCHTNLAIGHQLEGGFTQYLHLDANTVKLGPVRKITATDLSFEEAALAEPLACAINGHQKSMTKAGDSIVIFGCGPIGLMLARLGIYYGASQVIVLDPNQQRIQWAKKDPTLDTFEYLDEEDLVAKVLERTQGRGADRVFTACSVFETHPLALRIIGMGGVVNFFGGLPKASPLLELSTNDIHYREIYLTGSHGSTPEQHAKALELLEKRAINLADLITHRFLLEQTSEAYEAVMNGPAMKAVVFPNKMTLKE